jgi:hypothetical protein
MVRTDEVLLNFIGAPSEMPLSSTWVALEVFLRQILSRLLLSWHSWVYFTLVDQVKVILFGWINHFGLLLRKPYLLNRLIWEGWIIRSGIRLIVIVALLLLFLLIVFLKLIEVLKIADLNHHIVPLSFSLVKIEKEILVLFKEIVVKFPIVNTWVICWQWQIHTLEYTIVRLE